MYKIILALLFLCCTITEGSAQLKTPAASPAAKLIQTIGLTEIEIAYSRPSKNNRLIFGVDGLVPFGKQWRTGANSATKFKFSTDVFIQDQLLKKGAYTIITIDKVIAGPSVFDYYNAANYLYKSKTDLPRALTYIQKATGSSDPRFFFYRTESLIFAALGRYQEAIQSAEASIELSKKAKNEDFVRLSEKSIKEWKGK